MGNAIAQGTSLTRPNSSPLMKLAMRPKNSPMGAAADARSPSDSTGMPRLRPNHQIASAMPMSPP